PDEVRRHVGIAVVREGARLRAANEAAIARRFEPARGFTGRNELHGCRWRPAERPFGGLALTLRWTLIATSTSAIAASASAILLVFSRVALSGKTGVRPRPVVGVGALSGRRRWCTRFVSAGNGG